MFVGAQLKALLDGEVLVNGESLAKLIAQAQRLESAIAKLKAVSALTRRGRLPTQALTHPQLARMHACMQRGRVLRGGGARRTRGTATAAP